jgi:hypothetical protein
MRLYLGLLVSALVSMPVSAGVVTYGDEDCLGFGCYGANDPTAGATLQGLAANTVTQATNFFGHSFPFSPSADFAGTDQIYVGSVQTAAHDGYAASAGRLNGPQTLVLNYSSLVGAGQTVTSLTLGIAADDFQNPSFGQPYVATLNGGAASGLSLTLNALSETGPAVHFFTIGLSTALDNPAHTITLTIDQGGDGGDGWAVDFLTMGVTTSAASGVPEPAPFVLMLAPSALFLLRRARRS